MGRAQSRIRRTPSEVAPTRSSWSWRPARSGIAVTAKGIIQASPQEKPSVLSAPTGTAYDLSIDDRGGLGYVVAGKDGQAAAYVLSTGGKVSPREIASGDVTRL